MSYVSQRPRKPLFGKFRMELSSQEVCTIERDKTSTVGRSVGRPEYHFVQGCINCGAAGQQISDVVVIAATAACTGY